MRLMNSKDIEKIIEEKIDSEIISFDEELSGPCWEAKINRYENEIIFLVDGKKILTAPLPDNELTVEKLSYYIQFLKNDEIDQLSKELKV